MYRSHALCDFMLVHIHMFQLMGLPCKNDRHTIGLIFDTWLYCGIFRLSHMARLSIITFIILRMKLLTESLVTVQCPFGAHHLSSILQSVWGIYKTVLFTCCTIWLATLV